MNQTGLHKNGQAFTLIELLVVVGIIAILVAIAFPVFNTIRAKGDQVKCLSNLRQIGTAMGSYINDNNNNLPGPFVYGQNPHYIMPASGSTTENLAGYLFPYLSGISTGTTSSTTVAPIFVCPALQRLLGTATPSSTMVYYAENRDIPSPNASLSTGVDPFGIPTASGTSSPIRYALLSALSGLPNPANGAGSATANFSMSQTIMLTDVDQINWAKVVTADSAVLSGPLTAKPVHPTARNALFWDFHAESRALTSIP